MSLARLATLYALFGAIATALNLAAQAAVRALLPTFASAAAGPPPPEDLAGEAAALLAGLARPAPLYWLALCVGTGVGLVAKYLLDKRWIFDDRSGGVVAHGRRFSLYTLMGVATTVVFWGTQTAFYILSGSEAMLYVGGALGLAIGYVLKYRLDKRFVFTPEPAPVEARA